MTIEIIPSGASAVVTEREHHGHDDQGDRYRNHDRFAEVRRDVKDEGCEGVKATKDARYDIVNEMGKDFRDTGNQIERGFTAAALASCASNNQMCASFDSLKSTVRDGTDVTKDTYAQLQKQISDSANSSLVGFKDLTALSYQVEGRQLLEAAKNANAISVQADRNWAASNLQAVTFAAAAQLEAQKNAAAAAAQLAECCCELKEKIGDDGLKTRDLLNAITQQELRDRASRSQAALAAYFSAKVAPTSPIVGG